MKTHEEPLTVTDVGATQISPNCSVQDPEDAAYVIFNNNASEIFVSSARFWNIYLIPKYQKKQFGGFDASKAGNGICTRLWYGIPDASANGVNIGSNVKTEFSLLEGASASTPICASIATRINNAQLNMGKSPVGFINPALYSHPEVLNDITNGTNPGCDTIGFEAIPGRGSVIVS
ncbi:MAG: hypothetical protein LQ340_000780 [Diploschistes diacapsis]|nr:MAG: hypothetical protein LQ340_000780 [Diploschistes diacapsis]